MPTEQQKKKTGQTLQQTAQNVGDPSNMARILGTAGEGFADFLSKAYEYMVPQSVEELAMEGSPAGKAIGSAVSMISPKYIRALTARLKNKVLRPDNGIPFQDVVEEYIDRYPRVAAHIDDIVGQTPEPHIAGLFAAPAAPKPLVQDLMTSDKRVVNALDNNLPLFSPHTKQEARHLYGNAYDVGEPVTVMQLNSRMREDPRKVIPHEFNHVAQFAADPELSKLQKEIPYELMPMEIGSRMAEENKMLARMTGTRQRDMPEIMQQQLDEVNRYLRSPEYSKFELSVLRNLNKMWAPKGYEVYPDGKLKMRKIVLDRP